MQEVSDEYFDKVITRAMDELPQAYISNMKNVAIVIANQPTEEQRVMLNLRCYETLYGLYEGIPLPQRGGKDSMIPDKITLFKYPLLSSSSSEESFLKQIKHTLWHEIAHHYGLDHKRIHELEKK